MDCGDMGLWGDGEKLGKIVLCGLWTSLLLFGVATAAAVAVVETSAVLSLSLPPLGSDPGAGNCTTIGPWLGVPLVDTAGPA